MNIVKKKISPFPFAPQKTQMTKQPSLHPPTNATHQQRKGTMLPSCRNPPFRKNKKLVTKT